MRVSKCLAIILFAVLALPAIVSARSSLEEYSRAIEISPQDMKYKFYLLRGKTYKDMGDMNAALEDLSVSINLKPSITAYQYRGEVYFELERYTEAINDFSQALEINPTPELYELRSQSYLESGNYLLALADGLNTIDTDPYEPESYYVSMEALEKLGDIQLARELAFKVISLDRTNYKANEFIIKYPLKFLFIGDDFITIYVSHADDSTQDKANEILLKYKRGEKLDEEIKNQLNKCSRINEKLKAHQERLKNIWDGYFLEITVLEVRSRKILEDLRYRYLGKAESIEHEMVVWEKESEKCTEELIQVYRFSEM